MKTFWRIVGIGMLVAVLGLMTLGPVTSAQEERGSERSAEDCQAIGRRIRAAVKAGELTREEAGEMFEGLRRRMAVAERQR